MDHEDAVPGGSRPLLVRVPTEPVEAAVEADAVDAARREGTLVVRGPLFGVVAQAAEDGPRWRVVCPVTDGCPQLARDGLNSLLWNLARSPDLSREERRELLAAVARLETETVDELRVLGTRYRIVRAEEYAVAADGGIEGPRPTDPEPPVPDWNRASREPDIDDGLVLDPEAPVTPSQALEQLALRDLRYTGSRFPDEVRADSDRALTTHPDVLLLPACFTVVERHAAGWSPTSGPHPTAHAARKSLVFALTWLWPRQHGLIPFECDPTTDADSPTVDGRPCSELIPYAQAAAALRAERPDRLEFRGSVHQIGRTRRLVRWGPDGPEGPRPSDVNSQPPTQIHPPLDEDGRILPEL
ncbi:MAG TPA: DUF5954 family protein [Yinghuangia sp.]|uniref:DUF5954 family protein n=1 Tax=Yinghuangia sp. YIM S10712 TaxID=3436930 RepID=UPI002C22F751|nr:DUF5954 family protein [Yinghuangia sp.]